MNKRHQQPLQDAQTDKGKYREDHLNSPVEQVLILARTDQLQPLVIVHGGQHGKALQPVHRRAVKFHLRPVPGVLKRGAAKGDQSTAVYLSGVVRIHVAIQYFIRSPVYKIQDSVLAQIKSPSDIGIEQIRQAMEAGETDDTPQQVPLRGFDPPIHHYPPTTQFRYLRPGNKKAGCLCPAVHERPIPRPVLVGGGRQHARRQSSAQRYISGEGNDIASGI
ncbi:hypothetical protein D3C77_271100 [compost metagenome]